MSCLQILKDDMIEQCLLFFHTAQVIIIVTYKSDGKCGEGVAAVSLGYLLAFN